MPTLGPAALALLLSAFLVRARREQQLQQRDRQRVHPSMTSRSSSASSSSAASNDAEDVEAASRDGTGGGGVVRSARAGLQGCWALVSGAMRRNHLVVLYCFGAFVLVRMWFFAFARKDSKLISFCAFIMVRAWLAVCAYLPASLSHPVTSTNRQHHQSPPYSSWPPTSGGRGGSEPRASTPRRPRRRRQPGSWARAVGGCSRVWTCASCRTS